MNFSESFLFQTAKDYDIDLETVKEIAKKADKIIDDFYELLEQELRIRRNK